MQPTLLPNQQNHQKWPTTSYNITRNKHAMILRIKHYHQQQGTTATANLNQPHGCMDGVVLPGSGLRTCKLECKQRLCPHTPLEKPPKVRKNRSPEAEREPPESMERKGERETKSAKENPNRLPTWKHRANLTVYAPGPFSDTCWQPSHARIRNHINTRQIWKKNFTHNFLKHLQVHVEEGWSETKASVASLVRC